VILFWNKENLEARHNYQVTFKKLDEFLQYCHETRFSRKQIFFCRAQEKDLSSIPKALYLSKGTAQARGYAYEQERDISFLNRRLTKASLQKKREQAKSKTN
jgi:hypothetical protein